MWNYLFLRGKGWKLRKDNERAFCNNTPDKGEVIAEWEMAKNIKENVYLPCAIDVKRKQVK